MTLKIILDRNAIENLDLVPAQTVIEPLLKARAIASYEQQLQFEILYPRTPEDPRELSEIPEVRLWFIRLDTVYPWLPFLLNPKVGELARYAAMLVPHQFDRTEGIIFNPEALEIFVSNKIFVLCDWFKQENIPVRRSLLESMAQIVGYELDEKFFEKIL
jgi:hypothetical protein